MKLKEKLHFLLNEVNREIERVVKMRTTNKYADIKVCDVKLQCLESYKRDLEDVIAICDERNRY